MKKEKEEEEEEEEEDRGMIVWEAAGRNGKNDLYITRTHVIFFCIFSFIV